MRFPFLSQPVAAVLPAILSAVLSGCIPASTEPAAAPARPVPVPVVRPVPVVPQSSDWRDWPAIPGDWRYARTAGGSSATFGSVGADWALRLVCRSADRTIAIERVGSAAGNLTIRTGTLTRALRTEVVVTADVPAPPRVVAVVPAADPLLDAIGFSRGRFVVEGGAPGALVLPAWPETLRVVEDCRG